MSRRWVGIAIAVVLLLLLGCAGMWLLVENAWGSKEDLSTGEAALRQADQLLVELQESSDRLGAEDNATEHFPSCADLLSKKLDENANQYSLELVAETHPYDSFDAATVHVVFPDGSLVEMNYYHNYLETCRDLSSSSPPD